MKEAVGKGSFPFEMMVIPRNYTSLQKFPVTASNIVLANSQVAGCIARPEQLSDGDFTGGMSISYAKPLS